MEQDIKAANDFLASVEAKIAGLETQIAKAKSVREYVVNYLEELNGNSSDTSASIIATNHSEVSTEQLDLSAVSRGQAGLVVLLREKRPMPTKEIGDHLAQNGVDMSGQHALIILSNALARLAKQRIVRKRRKGTINIWDIIDTQRAQQIIAKPSQSNGSRKNGNITYGDVCEAAIKKAGKELHINELFKALDKYDLHPTRGTLARGLMTDRKKRFRNLGSNTYTLTAWDNSEKS